VNDEKKIMGIEDIVEEGEEKPPSEKEEVIVHFTFPKGSLERAKRNFERMSREDFKESVENSLFGRSLPEQIKERMVDNLMSVGKQKLAIAGLVIASVQSSQTGTTMDIYEKKKGGDNE